MMKLNTDEKRSLQFDVRIEGIDYKELQGSVKFLIDGVEYGFPVKILEDHIETEVLPLDEVVKKGLENDKEIECKLEVFGDGFYLKPWEGAFKLATPVRVEAKMRADDRPIIREKKEDVPVKKSITATLKEEKDEVSEAIKESAKPDKASITDADLMARLKNLLFEDKKKKSDDDEDLKPTKVKTDIPKIKPPPPEDEVIIQPKKAVGESKRALLEAKISKKLKEMKGVANKAVVKKIADKIMSIQESAPKKKVVQKAPLNRPPADVYELMESKGMTNKKTQKTIIEKAITLGGDDEDSIFSTVERLLDFAPPTSTFEEYSKKQIMVGMED